MALDVCVVTYGNTAERVERGLRPHDRLWIRDNTRDNIGFSRAANELSRRGSDRLLLFVNPDGDPQPSCFDRLEAAFSDPRVVAAAANEGPYVRTPAEDWLTGACLAVRRTAFEAAGGFDETIFMYGEDVDLSWRLARQGRLVRVDEAVFLHDSGPRPWLSTYRMTKNMFLVNARWGRPTGVVGTARRAAHDGLQGRWRLATARAAAVVAYGASRSPGGKGPFRHRCDP